MIPIVLRAGAQASASASQLFWASLCLAAKVVDLMVLRSSLSAREQMPSPSYNLQYLRALGFLIIVVAFYATKPYSNYEGPYNPQR